MVAGSFSFAIMTLVTHDLRHSFDWRLIAAIRAVIALAITIALAVSAQIPLVLFGTPKLWMRSIAGTVAMLGSFYSMTHAQGSAQDQSGVAEVSAVLNMFPLWVAVLSRPLLGKTPSWDVWVAAVIGLSGVILMNPLGSPKGTFALWTAFASSWASAVALIGLHQVKNLDSRAVVAHFSGVAFTCCFIAWIVALLEGAPSETEIGRAGSAVLWRLAFIGVCGAVGQLFLTRAFATGEPSRVSAVGLAQPCFVTAFELVLSKRSFSALAFLGMLLALVPTAWALLRSRRDES